MKLLIKAARVLASEVTPWNVQNMDCYPRIRLLFEILAEIGCPAEEIKRDIIAAANMRVAYAIVRDQLSIVELCG